MILKALILITIMVFLVEIIHIIVAQKVLNLMGFSMDRVIFRIFVGIGNAFVAFSISVVAGVLLLLLGIMDEKVLLHIRLL